MSNNGEGTLRPDKKQGAYGRVSVHKESTLSQLIRVDEVLSALVLPFLSLVSSNLSSSTIRNRFDKSALIFCDEILVKVSRSFAAVIRQLPDILLVDVMVFYLVLRALDTIEDDTTAFETHAEKISQLCNFADKALKDSTWSMNGVGEGDERRLLVEFPKCQLIYSQLNQKSREIIQSITSRMAGGMAEFVDKDMGQGTVDVEQYNRYCHFVAGLVGEGLSHLFAASGLENQSFRNENELSNKMGLFLQKTNIIRDYLEDLVDKRAFWPQTIWKKYSATGRLEYFADQSNPEAVRQALCCVNELVTDALDLAPDCLRYLAKLKCFEIFRFCAIPQVMAIATLGKVYANPNVFTGVVKIRKGLSCKLILDSWDMSDVEEIFHSFAGSVKRKATAERKSGVVDPSFFNTMRACEKIEELTAASASTNYRVRVVRWGTTAGLIVASLDFIFGGRRDERSKVSTAALLLASSFSLFVPWDRYVRTLVHQAHHKKHSIY